MNLETLKAAMRGARSRGCEYVTIFTKQDKDLELKFIEEVKDYRLMMQRRLFWHSQGYKTQRVFDLFYIDPEQLEFV